jgi:hypothetical protein
MTVEEKVNWVFDNINSRIIDKFFNISWNNDYVDIIYEINDSLKNFKFVELSDKYIVEINDQL